MFLTKKILNFIFLLIVCEIDRKIKITKRMSSGKLNPNYNIDYSLAAKPTNCINSERYPC